MKMKTAMRYHSNLDTEKCVFVLRELIPTIQSHFDGFYLDKSLVGQLSEMNLKDINDKISNPNPDFSNYLNRESYITQCCRKREFVYYLDKCMSRFNGSQNSIINLAFVVMLDLLVEARVLRYKQRSELLYKAMMNASAVYTD
ncbi:hypothetical protein LNL84_11575 [Vibrio sp. ZSDZ34]|uniref:Uncharacterized protein n=1 Tax=Vibrio gelatinilyticus TaxID=2893468 RepID=A0A9X2AWM9_9VIBR|nr:hypothetical protein [Vibrio gelatinilyticus]MCJ2377471.1 hypothetical protein [Vibrio gelatinilyticus]